MAGVKGKSGGIREGAGRPKLEVIRKNMALRAFPDEWELIKRFAHLVKHGHAEECKEFLQNFQTEKKR